MTEKRYSVPKVLNTAYDQGVEDGIRQERERIREALLSDVATRHLQAGFWKERMAAVLDSAGLGAVEESEK